ncbi:hypothetical protein FRB99_007479, partial [Tulasnella sp. 403]
MATSILSGVTTIPKTEPSINSPAHEISLPYHHGQAIPPSNDGPAARLRRLLREPGAEFLGTLILVLFGTAANCQTVLLGKGDWLSGCVGWGFGIGLGVLVCEGVSQGHINPAVTLAHAVFRRFPWKKVPIYWAAQLLGAFFGAFLTYGLYHNAIDVFEGGRGVRTVPKTAGLFGTFPLPYVTDGPFMSIRAIIFISTGILVITVLATVDKYRGNPPRGLVPFAVLLAMLGLSTVFGAQTSFAMNPARDLGPRMMSAIFYGREVFNFRHQYWIWGPVMADFLGGLAGAFVYDGLIYTGTESPIALR